MNFRVHHKGSSGLLIQLPTGGFGRVTAASCGADLLAARTIERANPQREDVIVCAPTGGSDSEGYALYSTDLRQTSSTLRLAASDKLAAIIVDLAKRNAICGLGRQCRARVVSEKAEGTIYKLSDGHTAVALGQPTKSKATARDAGRVAAPDEDDEAVAAAGAAAAVVVRVLSYDERGHGMVSCSADPAVVAGAHPSYTELLAASGLTTGLTAGATVPCLALLATTLNLAASGSSAVASEPIHVVVARRIVAPPTNRSSEANVAPSPLGHRHRPVNDDDTTTDPTAANDEAARVMGGSSAEVDLLVYVVLDGKQTAPAIGSTFSARLTYVPPPAMIVATPFVLATLPAAHEHSNANGGMPSSRLVPHVKRLQPDVAALPWRDPALNALEATAAEHDASMAATAGEAAMRRRRLEEAVDRFERQGESMPTTPEEFEKQLLATPTNSYIWTQFMAHHIAQRKVDAARTVAEKALARIPATESKELLNIWVAYLNLENSYGTAESLTSVFRRALERSDNTMTVHERLADIFAATGKKQQLVEVCKTMCSKFRKEPRVWERYARALVDSGKRDQLKRVFRDMEEAVPLKEQTLIAVHVAIHEYKTGSPEHGRAGFETLVARFPKRSDVWSAYLDQERALLARGAPEASVSGLRHVFERVATLSLAPKVMQSMLTQWLAFEQANGTAATVNKVKEKARAYVETRTAAAATAVAGKV